MLNTSTALLYYYFSLFQIYDWAFYVLFSLFCLWMSTAFIVKMITEGALKDPEPATNGTTIYKYSDSE